MVGRVGLRLADSLPGVGSSTHRHLECWQNSPGNSLCYESLDEPISPAISSTLLFENEIRRTVGADDYQSAFVRLLTLGDVAEDQSSLAISESERPSHRWLGDLVPVVVSDALGLGHQSA